MENEVHQRLKGQKPKQQITSCTEYVPVILQPYTKSKLKQIPNGSMLYEKDALVYQAMFKVHQALDGAKNLYFYAKKSNGKYVQLSHSSKFEMLFKRYKSEDGALRIYYNNDFIGSNTCVTYAFYVAQGVMVLYVIFLAVHYLQAHEYI